jgi:adenylylsulfate kinase-like enzyme
MFLRPGVQDMPARDAIVSRVNRLTSAQRRPGVLAIDGGSGAGKSLLASMVIDVLSAALIQTDDFYAANIPNAE